MQNKHFLRINGIAAALLECTGRTKRQLRPVCALITRGADQLLSRNRLRPAQQLRLQRQLMQPDLLHLFQHRYCGLPEFIVQEVDRPYKGLLFGGEAQKLRDRVLTLFMQSAPKLRRKLLQQPAVQAVGIRLRHANIFRWGQGKLQLFDHTIFTSQNP